MVAVTDAGETAPAVATRVQVFNAVAGEKLADLGVRPGEVYAFTVSPDRSRVVTQTGSPSADRKRLDRFVTTWDAKTGRKVAEVSPPEGATVGMLTVSPDNTTAVAAWGIKLNAFDLVRGKVLREFDTGGLYASTTPVFAPDGKTVAVGFGDGGSFGPATIRIYDSATGRVVRTFKGHDAATFSLAFSADGTTLASGSLDCTVLLWDVVAK
jgi:WD40 repeat protein